MSRVVIVALVFHTIITISKRFAESRTALVGSYGQVRPWTAQYAQVRPIQVTGPSQRAYATSNKVGTRSRSLPEGCAEYSWEGASPPWTWRCAQGGHLICRKETGGGGDCLFYSIAEALRSVGITSFSGYNVTVPFLRSIVATRFVGYDASSNSPPPIKWNPSQFLERLGVLATLEKHDTSSWFDGWSPSSILSANHYRSSSGTVFRVDSTEGKASAVHHELSRCGNVHWGSEMDILFLEDALNIGIILLRASTGKVYPLSNLPSRRYVYLTIYYEDDIHFQVAGIRVFDPGFATGFMKSAFFPPELPQFLLKWYKDDCKRLLLSESK